ncbi:Pkinase-domain-containing protein [Fomitiporia mediterranea MF3/22]|uniref:Pkinase-domain-containing protein n=1 Tax=Fomitiporia mediterranea (strain MF3/22) TaxID=694068 RepID=UPI00044082E6|nr:Pkinase-domain-containing protein [Fomitiporia mediterranea MF3/22]EJC98651.1 Pkinase-domain-containing protein [Fomitiporia mediterranea MF3/22]
MPGEYRGESFPPSKLGEYKVVDEIAEGTFGKVKMAYHTITGQKVAMKFLSKEAIIASRTKTRVQREVDYMRMLRHPHIIKLYEVISTPTDIIIVLEYAGGELFKYIVDKGRMPESQARRFFQQMISGIDYSHRLKIVHRDLKPENILLDDDLNVKIADFGLSNEIKDGDFLKTSCGSPNYAAPEVIRGALYTGPEVDVWSSGVILYVMLCGRLPFENEDVGRLFQQIAEGVYFLPNYLSHDARSLINGMLHVDPVKRLTISDIMAHPWFTPDLPRYLTPLPPPPGPVLGTLSSLVAPPKQLDFEIIEGLGRMEEDIVEELAARMEGVSVDEVWEALRREDGPQGNAVKVAYLLLRDKRRKGRDLAEFEDQEREAQLAALDPRNMLSPNALSPSGNPENEPNPFESEFIGDEEELDDEEGMVDFSTPAGPHTEESNFAVLNSSLPGGEQGREAQQPHHLASYATARLGGSRVAAKEKKQHRTRWHFGIRSRSPPMEVMSAIYASLKTLGMEWKEKKDLGGLCATHPRAKGNINSESSGHNQAQIERAREWDGHGGRVDLRAASSIYFVETRARQDDTVVLMNIQLYYVDGDNYLVDFHHKKSYRASTEPGAGRFDAAKPIAPSGSAGGGGGSGCPSESGSMYPSAELQAKEESVVSPYVFMDVACKLILDLAGGADDAR